MRSSFWLPGVPEKHHLRSSFRRKSHRNRHENLGFSGESAGRGELHPRGRPGTGETGSVFDPRAAVAFGWFFR